MVSAGLEDPATLGLAKIKGEMSSVLPTELLGGLLERAPKLKIDQSFCKFHYKRL
jgi:hypothetical protein